MDPQIVEDEVISIGNDVAVMCLPFSDISCHRVGAINKLYNNTNHSVTYNKVLQAMIKDREAHTEDKPKGQKWKQLFEDIQLRSTELDEDVKQEIEAKLNRLKLHRRKVKEKYEDELRWKIETAEQQVGDADRMLWGRGFVALEYDEFFVTPPQYNHYATLTPHWADRVEVGVSTREKALEKVSDWLTRQCTD